MEAVYSAQTCMVLVPSSPTPDPEPHLGFRVLGFYTQSLCSVRAYLLEGRKVGKDRSLGDAPFAVQDRHRIALPIVHQKLHRATLDITSGVGSVQQAKRWGGKGIAGTALRQTRVAASLHPGEAE
jgi:hypothetical protein